MRHWLFLLVMFYMITGNAQANKTETKVNSVAIEQYVNNLMMRQGIPGVSIAIIKDDEVVYQKNLGQASIEHHVPISDSSIFRVYSLTKPIVSVAVFQLIEQGKLDLEDTVDQFVGCLPESWNDIKVKHLLSHSSGLPDMAPIPEFKDLSEEEATAKVFKQELRFKKGDSYEYNQTGFWLLQKIIEKITGETLATFVKQNQFEKIDGSFFSSDSRDIILNRTTPYFPFSKGEITIDHSYLQGDYAHAENGLNLTLDAFIAWDRALRNYQLLRVETMDAMWQSFPYARSSKTFAYGWDKLFVNGHSSYGFTGSLCTAYRVFPEDNLSIIFLSNGLSHWYSLINAVNHLASIVDTDIIDLNTFTFETLLQSSFDKNIDDFKIEYKRLKRDPSLVNNNFEAILNDLGYFWLRSINDPEKAISIFQINTKEYPTSWNTYDSLGEALEHAGRVDQALVQYRVAVELHTDAVYKERMGLKIKQLENDSQK